jgi:O-acetyl-ADP-ribose deacetylase (regulator of RNase III)
MNRVQIIKGDITKQRVDVIVNAANTSLLGGGGVDGAIHKAAGPELLQETSQMGGCPTGEVRISKGYHLPAKWVFHTVGPIWHGGQANESAFLAKCYRSCFLAAKLNTIQTIAFPSISTGIYGYPLKEAVKIALRETQTFLSQNKTLIRTVAFVCFDSTTFETYTQELQGYL